MKLVVIGAGPAGEAAAKFAAKAGAEVTILEKEYPGGICLNSGCIPSKAFLSYCRKIRDSKTLPRQGLNLRLGGSAARRKAFWKDMREKKDQVVQILRGDIEKSLSAAGVKLAYGQARFATKKTLEVTTKARTETLAFDKAIIATGSIPIFPPPLNKHRDDILDSDWIFDFEKLPDSMVIVGGGAVGCEFACLLHELDVEVTIVEMTGNLLPGEDPQVVNVLRKSFEARGIAVKDSVTVVGMEKRAGLWRLTLSNQEKVSGGQVLTCVGRKARVETLQLNNAAIGVGPKGIQVNAQMQTSNEDVYACGDVTGLSLLAHAGAAQAEVAAANALGESRFYDGSLIPRCLYTWPEVASVGLWAYQAQEKKIEVKNHRFFFAASGRALAEGESEGFIQIVLEKATEKILGAQIIGPAATELIHIFSVAIKGKMGKSDIQSVVFAHPTLGEGIKAAFAR